MLKRVAHLLKMTPPDPTAKGLLFSSGTTVPGDGTAGYQPGCIFQHVDGSAGTAFYVNEGTEASCDFNAVAPAGNAVTATTVVTTDDVSSSKTLTSATPATERLVRSELTLTPATSLAVGSSGSLAAMRGCVTLTTGKSITDGYLYGSQGKVTLDGATIAVGSDHIAGVYAQLSATGSTFTSGHIAAVIGSIQGVPTSSVVDLFYGESATGNVINSFFKAFGKADYVFDFETNVHTQISTPAGSTPSGNLRVLKVKLDGADYYILAAATYGA